VKWPPACEDMSPEAEGCPLLEDVTEQAMKTENENTSNYVTVICKV
jgi:hypothetical protein